MGWPLNEAQTITVVASGLGASVSACAAVAAAWFANKNLKVSLLTIRIKYFEDFKRWADEVVDTLTEAIHLCDLDPNQLNGETFFDRRHRLRIKISAMIDKGRWFFPNIVVDEHGVDKELGYRGYRHELLDGLVQSYRVMQKMDFRVKGNNSSTRGELTICKRHFVGQVQKILDPDGAREEFDRIHFARP